VLYQTYYVVSALIGTYERFLRYGLPIGSWYVSRVINFTRVFDPGREKTLDYNRNPSTRSSFEDLSSWNLSNAISVRGLFVATGSVTGKDPEM
jgi:hypothetical protein